LMGNKLNNSIFSKNSCGKIFPNFLSFSAMFSYSQPSLSFIQNLMFCVDEMNFE
jgi:hypothetical protein